MFNLRYLFNCNCCGYYCLKHISLNIIAKKKKLMSMYEMKEALLNNGYFCYGLFIENIDDVFKECITLIRKGKNFHYIIIKKVTSKYVLIYDPLFIKEKRVHKKKFTKKWSHNCLLYKKSNICL